MKGRALGVVLAILILGWTTQLDAMGAMFPGQYTKDYLIDYFVKGYRAKWQEMYDDYMAERRKLEMGYIQSWNQNMQSGIRHLQRIPHNEGVTPLNGALVLSVTDATIPERGGMVPIVRTYNSKFWYGDEASTWDSLRAFSYCGMGWDINFGEIVSEDTGKTLVSPNGLSSYYTKMNSQKYVSNDATFREIKHSLEVDTVFKPDGTIMIYKNCWQDWDRWYMRVTKIIDNNGNITSFHYDTCGSAMGGGVYIFSPGFNCHIRQ